MRFCSHNPNNFSLIWVTILFQESQLYYRDEDGWPSGPYADLTVEFAFLDKPE